MRYIVESHIRELVRRYGKRVGKGFLHGLSAEVEHLVERAARERDGGRKTIDKDTLAFILRRGRI